MSWMDWIALKHDLFVHLPIAAALLAPLALVAAQRPGRGIKPWWTACRYLAWAGVLGGLTAVISGFRAAQVSHLLPDGEIIARGSFQNATVFQLHQWIAGASILLGVLTLKALHRKREEHQGIGVLGLFFGLLWACATAVAGFYGHQLSHPAKPPMQTVAASKPVAPAPVDTESSAPLRALDYLSLVPMHSEPVKSAPHGGRWIRVWTNEKAAEAYREGKTLPEGSLVVLSSLEDRWGKPGFDQGPLYSLEVKPGGKPNLTFYWAHVPEGRRNETQGRDRVYWRGDDKNLKNCLACHAEGAAPMRDRSRWIVPKPKPRSGSNATE
jgi:hypothetical protein